MCRHRWSLLSALFVIFGFLSDAGAAKLKAVEEVIRDDSDLSEFYALLERSKIANSSLMYRSITIFAPTNQAFQRYKGPKDDSLVLYHMSNTAMPLDHLSTSINSELDGNLPLWMTRIRSTHHDDIYINNAKVLVDRSDYVSFNQFNKKQVLHVIDDVLMPVSPSATVSDPIYNPNAYEFLQNSENFDIGTHRVRSFRQKVSEIKKAEIFKNDGRHTFFIPVDEGFKPQPRPEMVDARVIDGHVIPNKVLFTKPTADDRPFETLAFTDNLKVTISFATTHDGQETQTYVKSNTLMGDSKHATGVVMADIVKANIPVKNGVVHLIQRPLMVVDTTVTQFLETFKDKEDGPLYKFYEVIMDMGGDFMKKMTQMQDLTLFAPSNEAWRDPTLNDVIRNKNKLREILNMHLVREKLPLDKIIHNNLHQVPTAADRKNLYFNVVHHGNNQTLTVEGGGVNATVIQPNIAAINGIVHIINRVLGVPYTTLLQKMETDPMLNETYNLGKRRNFNYQLNDTTKRFTYFVPRDRGWQQFAIDNPSAAKKLHMDDFSYHTQQILQRHLVISDRSYTMSDIKLLANDTHGIVLPTMRDTLRLRVKETDKNYYVEWQNDWILVFRPDVECINGIIHVIDAPLLHENDIYVTFNGVMGLAATFTTLILPNIIMVVITKWLLH